MIEQSHVFDAVRRGYSELDESTNSEILDYFSNVDVDSVMGHVSNIKGILFEQEYVNLLSEDDITAEIFDATNHPISDIIVFDDHGIGEEIQLKATDSVSYIHAAIAENPDIPIVTTTEVAGHLDGDMFIDSGIENDLLEDAVVDTLFDDVINPFSLFSPIRVAGWFFGLIF